VVFSESDLASSIFLIKSGEFEVSKHVHFGLTYDNKIAVLTKVVLPNQGPEEQALNEKKNIRKSFHKSFSIAILGSFQIVGLEVVAGRSEKYLTKVTCQTSKGSIYQLGKDYILKLRSEDVQKSLYQASIDKLEFLQRRLGQIGKGLKRKGGEVQKEEPQQSFLKTKLKLDQERILKMISPEQRKKKQEKRLEESFHFSSEEEKKGKFEKQRLSLNQIKLSPLSHPLTLPQTARQDRQESRNQEEVNEEYFESISKSRKCLAIKEAQLVREIKENTRNSWNIGNRMDFYTKLLHKNKTYMDTGFKKKKQTERSPIEMDEEMASLLKTQALQC